MTATNVRYALDEHIAVLTMDDPQRRNALSRAIVAGMLRGLERALAEHARAVVIAGEGKAFCSGANMDDLRGGWMDGNESETDPVRLFRALTELPIPVIAAVHGAALGGGFELTLCCDLVVATEDAWFALPELGVGVIPNTALARLPQLVGARKALELVMRRERVVAADALALGLVVRTCAPGNALQSACELGRQICGGTTPSALAVAKEHLRGHHPTDWERVRSSLHEVDRAEWHEGLSAFSERRPFDHEKFWKAKETP